MDPLLVLSPHYDDAVLSAGQFLASYPGATVVTVMGGAPARATPLTTYDRDCGFARTADAVKRRAGEDASAMAIVGARSLHLDFLDAQYRENHPVPVDDVVRALTEVVHELQPVRVLVPLGLEHPDHRVVHEAALRLVTGLELDGEPVPELYLYEELPHRVLWPVAVVERLDKLRAEGWTPDEAFLGTGPKAVKRRAVNAYRSQLWALDLDCVFVPERFWRFWRLER